MKRSYALLAVIATGAASLTYWLSTNYDSEIHAQANDTPNTEIAGSHTNSNALRPLIALGNNATMPTTGVDFTDNTQASPFSNVAIGSNGSTITNPQHNPDPEIVPPEEAARRIKMKQLGYMVPPEYYQKDISTLRQMAKNGDAFAMVHLGEKYYFELNGNRQNPEFDPKIDYGSAARQSFSEALASGNIRSAAIIAETYLQEKNHIDAYAWYLMSEQLGDSISVDWFKTTKTYTNLTTEERQLARAKLPELVQNVTELGKKMNTKPIFSKQS